MSPGDKENNYEKCYKKNTTCYILFSLYANHFSCKTLFFENEPPIEDNQISQSTPVFISNTPINGTLTRALDGMVMVSISEGEFIMGVEGEKIQQQHLVYLDTYWIDQTEVTNGMYARCVEDGVCQEPSQSDSRSRENYYNHSAYAEYPVIYVSWNQRKLTAIG